MEEMKVKSRHMVKPAEQTWQGILPLSVLDNITVITHSSMVYFYEKPSEEWLDPSDNKIINTLKDSLSRALVAYYPLAGRARYIGGGRFELDCNAEGALLLEVESGMKISDLGELYFSREKIPQLVAPLNYYVTPIEEIPVQAVQVTRFACGGLSIGMSTSHLVADGTSAFRFYHEWARIAVGKPPLVESPTFDRSRLIVDHDDSHYRKSENSNVNYFKEFRLHEKDFGKLHSPLSVVLKKGEVEKLKEVAKEDGQRPYSRFEVMAAHVWRSACKARELPDEEMASIRVIVGIYDRMDPPLPSSFIGNAVIDALATSRVGELVSKPLSYACSAIRKAIKAVNNEYITDRLKFYQSETELLEYQVLDDRGTCESMNDGDGCITIVSWLNLMVDELDFGWGKEIQFVPSMAQTSDGDIQITPYGKDGSVVVEGALEPGEKFVKFVGSAIE